MGDQISHRTSRGGRRRTPPWGTAHCDEQHFMPTAPCSPKQAPPSWTPSYVNTTTPTTYISKEPRTSTGENGGTTGWGGIPKLTSRTPSERPHDNTADFCKGQRNRPRRKTEEQGQLSSPGSGVKMCRDEPPRKTPEDTQSRKRGKEPLTEESRIYRSLV